MSPWATVKIVEGAGHFMQLEKPTEVNKLIIDWITAK
jgi:pimeloyl-ACP methyl ester carboxylesterase